MPDVPDGELCRRYADLYTGLVADALDDHGYRDQTLDTAIGPVREDMTAAGLAFPCVGKANRDVDAEEQMRSFLTMLGDVPEHGMLVIAANSDDAAQIGELTTTALDNRGCRGAVVDGGTRDTGFILDQDYPVFTRYKTPADSITRWELLDWDCTAVVGGVEVSPGDVVVGDIDGVTVVPSGVAESVLEAAEAMRDDEDSVREAIREGRTPIEAYEQYGTF
ncbi:MAG: RraA family protein [Halobacteriaceae archaeon]